MLKRQRPSSPPPSSSFVEFPEPTSSSDHAYQRDLKRRRMSPSRADAADGNAAEHDDSEYDSAPESDRIKRTTQPVSEYKSANSLLHDLHALHRHRLLFAAPSDSLRGRQPPIHDKDAPPWLSDHGSLRVNGPMEPELEAQMVVQRYEDTNKTLGQLFLSRRRDLGPGS